jgi:hypothetical protein
MNYVQLYQAIQDYSENTESLFVSNIPTFVQEAEKRIYNSVQLPSLRKNVIGNASPNNQYLSLPNDWLSTYSIAIIESTGKYTYLLNKDVNFLRESYPNPSTTGLPKYYAIFGPTINDLNELSAILAPTPNIEYTVELHYYYYPITIVQGSISSISDPTPGTGYSSRVYNNIALTGGAGTGATATIVVTNGGVSSVQIINQGQFYRNNDTLSASLGSGSGFSVTVTTIANPNGTSWLGDNYDPVLFYGAMREAVVFMKGEQDMVTYYEKMFQEGLGQLKRLGDGLERNDAYRKGQTSLEYKGL